jgi:hypothetical protein
VDRMTFALTDAGGFDRPVPAGYAFATIGPKSLVDLVEIEGSELGLDVPAKLSGAAQKISRVRPMRVTGGQVNSLLELCLWRDCETPVASKRDPVVRTNGDTALAAPYERRIRLPFAGRRAGVVHMNGDTGKAFRWAIYGVKYVDTLAVAALPRDMYNLLDSGTETPAASLLALVGVVGLSVFLGGLDRHLDFDEIEVWTRGDAAPAEIDTRAEAYDLCR